MVMLSGALALSAEPCQRPPMASIRIVIGGREERLWPRYQGVSTENLNTFPLSGFSKSSRVVWPVGAKALSAIL
jgi:hypothetical protein